MRKHTGTKSLLLSTRAYNELVDVASWVRDHARQLGRSATPALESQSWIWCENQTGAAVVSGSILGLGPPTVLAAQNEVSWQHQVAHVGVLPSATTHGARFGVTLTAVPPGAFLPLLVAGVASVRIEVQSAHLSPWQGRAKLVPGNTSRVESDPAGPIIVLWCASAVSGGTAPQTAGVQRARILVPGQLTSPAANLPRLGRLTADLPYNSTASIPLLTGAVGSETLPSSPELVTGHNLLYRQLWSGANVSLVPHDVSGASASTLRIVWSNSASRLRGITAGSISPGTSGTLQSVLPLDGHVGPGSSVTAHNVLANYTIGSGVTAWAEWTQSNGRWEIYAADCAGS